MKAQLNLRKGSSKSGFRILRRFSNIKEAREFLMEFLKSHTGFQPTEDTDVFYDIENGTHIWLSKQFTPTGDYRYRNPNK